MAHQDRALAFWAAHSLAIGAIGEVYGPNWAIKAPIGETVLVRLPASFCVIITERGTRLRWRRDWRMPAVRFWPDLEIPGKHESSRDHPRYSAPSCKSVL